MNNNPLWAIAMSDSLRNRLVGAGLLALGLAGVFASPELSEGLSMLFSFATGAALGAGGALLITGESLWESGDWWASRQPGRRS